MPAVTFDLQMLVGLPVHGEFEASGRPYRIHASAAHPGAVWPVEYTDKMAFEMDFASDKGAKVSVKGAAEYESHLHRIWGWKDEYVSRPRPVLLFGVEIDGVAVLNHASDVNASENERLRAVVLEARSALAACGDVCRQRFAEAQAAAEKVSEQRALEAAQDVADRLDRL